MQAEPWIVVTVATDGTVSAETVGLTGAACLDYIGILEDLLEARTVRSAYTAEYDQPNVHVADQQELRGVDHA
ncbi:DUF2997 domain-containing protein [Micromonospora sp. WMMD1102]|uniref:DUF2997 domain-containing protein n=1 Tax=Micromonospora sp. WMMD1102 TaxID=3016105 RepID=UPI0024158E39|nr:DUF2997 domain-containing protein [Micromonospora sp. WMMD1102]MDG4785621.1 DUF2997 domain-containing protein [Micromonospora sp. WMMD1102]